MRIQNCPVKEVGATFSRKSSGRYAQLNPDGTRAYIEYVIKPCRMVSELNTRRNRSIAHQICWTHSFKKATRNNCPETGCCEEKFATTLDKYKKIKPRFLEAAFCVNCRNLAYSYIRSWKDKVSGIIDRKTEYGEEEYIWHNYVIPFGKYQGELKNYWE